MVCGIYAVKKGLDPPIEKVVKENQAELMEIVETILENKTISGYSSYKGFRILYSHEYNDMILFGKAAGGFGSETCYKGFYYSPNDQPLSSQGEGYTATPEGEEWHWSDGTDNWSYTERIMENWFSFSEHW